MKHVQIDAPAGAAIGELAVDHHRRNRPDAKLGSPLLNVYRINVVHLNAAGRVGSVKFAFLYVPHAGGLMRSRLTRAQFSQQEESTAKRRSTSRLIKCYFTSTL